MYRITVAAIFLCISVAGFGQKKIIVSQDGTGDYKTVQAALDAVPLGNTEPITIFVRKGTYKELIVVDAKKPFIKLVGEDRNSTILTYNNHKGGVLANGDSVNTQTSASFFEYADDFHAENISFENNAGFTAGQAVALRVDGNRASFKNCSMLGFQDVLLLNSKGKLNYFEDCYIEGTTDFIFGAAGAVC
jgi:pectinesterase